MVKILLLTTLFVAVSTFASAQSKASEKKLVEMMCLALSEFSTAPDYVVVNVITVVNGAVVDTNEICMESTSLFIALCNEHDNWGYRFDCVNNPSRYHSFSVDSALRYIPSPLYTKQELLTYSKKLKLSKLISDIKSGRMTAQSFSDEKEQLMFAHIMVLHGVRVKRGCLAGNICHVSYFSGSR